MTTRAWAEHYNALGLSIFPIFEMNGTRCSCDDSECRDPGKHPRISGGFKAATTSLTNVQYWWEQWPDASIGLATGEINRVLVLDIDPRHDGLESMKKVAAQYGKTATTPTTRTGGQGFHLFFDYAPSPSRVNVLPGVDVRCDNGYVILPPSSHVNGRRYEWMTSRGLGEVEFAQPPEWLLLRLAKQNRYFPANKKDYEGDKPRLDVSTIPPIPEPGRNNELMRYAGRLVWEERYDKWQIEALIHKINAEKCEPPLPPKEVKKLVESAWRYA